MHKVKYIIGLILLSGLSGCGQSGALQLTNDPDLDTRPKYLLWHPADHATNNQKDSTVSSKN
ncbi:lipoprotein [Acinetobacter boissieri]|uniref:Lipoprotein-attachment site-containing protein n=1 Tax=Acinetobacter boissieri TaxID=1219383 RepID=A0A1G6GQU0_9GAMM|nr:lipoprotein [Acinetobacter boissieri]SDB84370.1 hypothetical protein SAMN05421733_10243 [Acinetobacter boissieri]